LGFFHSSLAPTPAIGCVWPPVGIEVFSPFEIPLLNTCLLLSSGATITLAHFALLKGDSKEIKEAFIATLAFAVLFTLLQLYEYNVALFLFQMGFRFYILYGYGFHGFHVMLVPSSLL